MGEPRKPRRPPSVRPTRRWTSILPMLVAFSALGSTPLVAQSGGTAPQIEPIPTSLIFTFLFLMLGPIKIIGPYAALTRNADRGLARQLAFRATLYAGMAVLLAAVVGQSILERYAISVEVLALAAGLILFLVALQSILQQFDPTPTADAAPAKAPTIGMAMTPLAFPTIVTPHGIAALIVFMSLSPDLRGKATILAVMTGIMALNFVAMLAARHILKVLGVFLQILGSVLGIIQVALGLDIMVSAVRVILG